MRGLTAPWTCDKSETRVVSGGTAEWGGDAIGNMLLNRTEADMGTVLGLSSSRSAAVASMDEEYMSLRNP
jgi:hypothetical protein